MGLETEQQRVKALFAVFGILLVLSVIFWWQGARLPGQDRAPEPDLRDIVESEVRQFTTTVIVEEMQPDVASISPVKGLKASGTVGNGNTSRFGYRWTSGGYTFYVGVVAGTASDGSLRVIDKQFTIQGKIDGTKAKDRLKALLRNTTTFSPTNISCTSAQFRDQKRSSAAHCKAFWTGTNKKIGFTAQVRDNQIVVDGCKRTPEMVTYHFNTCDVNTLDAASRAEQLIRSFVRSSLTPSVRPKLWAIHPVPNLTVEPDHQTLNGNWNAYGYEWSASGTNIRVEVRTITVRGEHVLLDRRFKVGWTSSSGSDSKDMLRSVFGSVFRYNLSDVNCSPGDGYDWAASNVTECTAFWRPTNTTAFGFTAAVVPETGYVLIRGCERTPAMETFDYTTCKLEQTQQRNRNDELPANITESTQ